MPATAADLRTIRLLIADTDPAQELLADQQLSDLYALEGDVRLAAAAALEVIATSEVLVGKAIRTQDLSTDGAKVSAELRARAAALRAQVDAAVEGDGYFTVVGPAGVWPELADRPAWF